MKNKIWSLNDREDIVLKVLSDLGYPLRHTMGPTNRSRCYRDSAGELVVVRTMNLGSIGMTTSDRVYRYPAWQLHTNSVPKNTKVLIAGLFDEEGLRVILYVKIPVASGMLHHTVLPRRLGSVERFGKIIYSTDPGEVTLTIKSVKKRCA